MKTFLTLFSLLCMLFISCSKEEVDALTYQVRIEATGPSFSIEAKGDLTKQIYLTETASGKKTYNLTPVIADEVNISINVLKDSLMIQVYSGSKLIVNEKRFKGLLSYHIQETK